jgi:hypothetical protein
LKERLAAALGEEFSGRISLPVVRQAIVEADALASTTAFRALVLPVLAEEKARRAADWASRQDAIREHSVTLAA